MTGRVFMYEGSPVDFAAVILGMLNNNKAFGILIIPIFLFT